MGGEYYHHLYCVEWEERLSNLPKVIKLVRGQEFESVKLVLQACAFPAVLNQVLYSSFLAQCGGDCCEQGLV